MPTFEASVPLSAASPERPLPALATVNQVAAHVQVHPRTVRTWLADGRLKFLKVGGKAVRIARTEIERFLAGVTS